METASQKVPKKPPPWEPKLRRVHSYATMDKVIKARKKRNSHDYDRCNCSPRIANSLPLAEYALLTSQKFQKNTVMSLRAGLAINVSGVIRISLKNEHGSLKSDQNFLWAVFNGEQEKVVLVFSL